MTSELKQARKEKPRERSKTGRTKSWPGGACAYRCPISRNFNHQRDVVTSYVSNDLAYAADVGDFITLILRRTLLFVTFTLIGGDIPGRTSTIPRRTIYVGGGCCFPLQEFTVGAAASVAMGEFSASSSGI